MTPPTPAQFWLAGVAIGVVVLVPATYVYRCVKHSPSRQEVGKLPQDLSWRSPAMLILCAAAIIALAGLAVFIFTPAFAEFSWVLLPISIAVVATFPLYRVFQGFRTGHEKPIARGSFPSYNRSTQPKRYWASMIWNSIIALLLGVMALAGLWGGSANAG